MSSTSSKPLTAYLHFLVLTI